MDCIKFLNKSIEENKETIKKLKANKAEEAKIENQKMCPYGHALVEQHNVT